MTDLKAANEQLAKALKALESPEHDADVREAEACRNRLMELDERIGARIKAKLEAHKAIALAWKEDGAVTASGGDYQDWLAQQKARLYVQDTNASALTTDSSIEAPLDGLTADAWTAHHEEHTGKYALAGEQVPDRVMVNGVAEMQQADD